MITKMICKYLTIIFLLGITSLGNTLLAQFDWDLPTDNTSSQQKRRQKTDDDDSPSANKKVGNKNVGKKKKSDTSEKDSDLDLYEFPFEDTQKKKKRRKKPARKRLKRKADDDLESKDALDKKKKASKTPKKGDKKTEAKKKGIKDKNKDGLADRLVEKTLRTISAIQYGMLINEAYLNSHIFGFHTGMYFNEKFGIEGHINYLYNMDNADKKELKKIEVPSAENPNDLIGIDPGINPINTILDVMFSYAPLYGVHSSNYALEFFLLFGASYLVTEQRNVIGISYGLGEYIFFRTYFGIRFQFIGRVFKDMKGFPEKSTYRHALNFTVGIDYFN